MPECLLCCHGSAVRRERRNSSLWLWTGEKKEMDMVRLPWWWRGEEGWWRMNVWGSTLVTMTPVTYIFSACLTWRRVSKNRKKKRTAEKAQHKHKMSLSLNSHHNIPRLHCQETKTCYSWMHRWWRSPFELSHLPSPTLLYIYIYIYADKRVDPACIT